MMNILDKTTKEIDRERIETLLSEAEMILIGIGSGLEKDESNAEAVDAVYEKIAAYVKGKNYFVITGNTDGKLLDGTIFHMLVAAPNMEGQEEAWKSYLNWLTCTLNHKLVILELGEGFRQPQLMRWPFEQVVTYNKKAALVRVGRTFSQVPKELSEQAISVPMRAGEFVHTFLGGIR